MGREKLRWLWILNSELKRKIGDLFKQIYMTEDSFLKVYLRGCFTDIMQPYLRGNFAS